MEIVLFMTKKKKQALIDKYFKSTEFKKATVEINKIVRDKTVYGRGFYFIDKDGNIKHVPYLDVLNDQTK